MGNTQIEDLKEALNEGTPINEALRARGINTPRLTAMRVSDPYLDVLVTRLEADNLLVQAAKKEDDLYQYDPDVQSEVIKSAKALRAEAMALRKMAEAKAQRYKIGQVSGNSGHVPHLGLGSTH